MSSNHSIPDNEDFPALTSAAPTAQVRGVWAQRKPDQMMKLSTQNSDPKPSASVLTGKKANNEGVSRKQEDIVDKTSPSPNRSSSVIDSSGAAEAPTPIKAISSTTPPISVDLELSELHMNDTPTLQPIQEPLHSPEENMWCSLRNVDPNGVKLPTEETEDSKSNVLSTDLLIVEGDKSSSNSETKVSNSDCISPPGCSDWGNIAPPSPTISSASQISGVVASPSSSGNTPIICSTDFPGLPSSSTKEIVPHSPTPALDQADFPSLCPSAPVPTPVWNRAPPPAPPTPVAPPIESAPLADIDFNESSNRKTMKSLSMGTKNTLMTNCYPMTVEKTEVSYNDVKMKKIYSVKGQKRFEDLTEKNKKDAKKKIDNKEWNLRILQLRRLRLTDVPFAYDGCHNLYLLRPLETLIGRTYVNQYFKKDDLPEDMKQALFNQSMSGDIHVSLEPNDKAPFYQLEEIYEERLDDGVTACRNVIQLILIQPAKNGDFIILGQNQVFEKSKFRRIEGQKFEMGDLVKVGIKATVKVGEGENSAKGVPFVCLDHCKANFFLEGPLTSVQDYLPVNFEIQASCRKYLIGLEVYCTYNNIRMRIVDFSADSLENKQFKETNSKELKSVWDNAAKLANKKKSEFNKNYRVALVTFGSSKKSYMFPVEILRVAPYQKMGPQHGPAPTPSTPQERVQESQRIAEKAGILKLNKLTKAFGINVDSEPIQVTGWTLPLPQILYAGPNQKPHRVPMDASASWNPSGKFVAPSCMKRIHILYAESTKNKNLKSSVEAFKKDLMNESASLWTKLTDKQITIEKLDVEYRGNSLEGILTAKLEKMATDTYVIYIDEKRDNPSHGAVKLVERRTGRMIQHVAIDEALKRMKSKSTCQFILMKMNVKLGGLNHRVQMNGNISHLWGEHSNTLIISYDVCHSSGARTYTKGESTDEPSVVGFGFNGLRLPEQVIGDFAFQDSRQEQVDCEILMKKTQWMVNLYCENRKNCPPANIVILRDGVSEGQYKMTQNKELNAILNGIHEAMRMRKMNTFRPKFAYIIATKRHANRLFVKNADSITNAPPMTAIDTGIVRKGGDEVIFVSHHPLGGTAQPIMLNTLHNEIFESHDQLISFIGALCCTHQRSTSIISLPETIFTADAYAKRGAELFETYSHCVRTKKDKLPMRERGKPDWAAITETLCYQTSTFATKCMV